MIDGRPVDSSMDQNQKLMTNQVESSSDPKYIEGFKNLFILLLLDLIFLLELVLLVSSCGQWCLL